MKVYVLWHVYKLSDDIGEHDEEKLVGIYSTEKKARDAIQNHKDLEGDVICETFYTYDSGKTYGLTYDKKGELNMLSIESQNEKGLPVEYIVYRKEIWNFGNPLKNRINYATYEYDENDKIKGGSFIYEMIVNPKASNDPEELLYSISNPPHDYYLSYDDETVVSYTRTDYSSSLELLSGVGGPWKFPGYLLKRYHEFGIEYI